MVSIVEISKVKNEKMGKVFVLYLVLVLVIFSSTAQTTAIIPKPVSFIETSGDYTFAKQSKVNYSSNDTLVAGVAKFLKEKLLEDNGINLSIKKSSKNKKGIRFVLKDKIDGIINVEGYTLTITKNGVEIAALNPTGLFYGAQTLRQLMLLKSSKNGEKISVPCLIIKDYPQFAWRGLMIDASRHFQDVNWVKKYIDWLAFYKINTFHWHLTDSHGWRIEIEKYSKLTSVGAWRDQEGYPGRRYGGYYTKKEIREVVKYAQERFVTIVPEIDVPGHSAAMIAAYPELTCFGKTAGVRAFTNFPVIEARNPCVVPADVCPGNDYVFSFLSDVFKEVAELFPGKYFHIGGDECGKLDWKNCPKCQSRIKTENLANEFELQSYFICRMEKILTSYGKNLVGWNEILEGGLAPNATVMSWQGEDGGLIAARSGHNVVMTPQEYLYFDHAQSNNPNHPKSWGEDISTLEEVYNYYPIPKSLEPEYAKHVLGAQACLWTVFTHTTDLCEIMTFPRICAFSEAVWTPLSNKDWNDFQLRVNRHLENFKANNLNYYSE